MVNEKQELTAEGAKKALRTAEMKHEKNKETKNVINYSAELCVYLLCVLCGKLYWNRFFSVSGRIRMTKKVRHVRWRDNNQEWTHRCRVLCQSQVNLIRNRFFTPFRMTINNGKRLRCKELFIFAKVLS